MKRSEIFVGSTFEMRAIPGWSSARFITVLDKFEHHFTGETVYEIRIEQVGVLGSSLAERKYVTEEYLEELLKDEIV